MNNETLHKYIKEQYGIDAKIYRDDDSGIYLSGINQQGKCLRFRYNIDGKMFIKASYSNNWKYICTFRI